jgi:gas vesicle protein
MMAKDESGSGIVWFLAGAAVGASVALLYAPKTGRETRKYISKASDKSKDAISESGKELVDRGKELYDRGRALADEAADLFEKGRKLVKG